MYKNILISLITKSKTIFQVATKVGAASLFMHPLFRDGWEPRRRGSCESGFWSCVGEDLSPEPPNRRHTSTLSSSAASSLFLLDDHRTSSIYTDSSEDIASLGGGDSCWEDRLSGIGSSSKTISKIVEYFEKKQAGSLRLTDYDPGSSRLTLLKASLEGPVPLCNISAAQRLVVCEGAVRSKLSLFDKKWYASLARRRIRSLGFLGSLCRYLWAVWETHRCLNKEKKRFDDCEIVEEWRLLYRCDENIAEKSNDQRREKVRSNQRSGRMRKKN